MKWLVVIAVFTASVCLTSSNPVRDQRFKSAKPDRRSRSIQDDCAEKNFNRTVFICCGGKVHRRGKGAVDCCNGTFFNPTTHTCYGRAVALKCPLGMQWHEAEDNCQPCPDGYYRSLESFRGCKPCHKCSKYGKPSVFRRCTKKRNALCDYPWIWEKLQACSIKGNATCHYKSAFHIHEEKTLSKIKRWRSTCEHHRNNKRKHKRKGKYKICEEWRSRKKQIANRRRPSPTPQLGTTMMTVTFASVSSFRAQAKSIKLTTPNNLLKDTVESCRECSNAKVTASTKAMSVTSEFQPPFQQDSNTTQPSASTDITAVPPTLLAAAIGAVIATLIVASIVIGFLTRPLCHRGRHIKKRTKKRGQASSQSTLLSARLSSSASKSYDGSTSTLKALNVSCTDEQTSLSTRHLLLMRTACSNSSRSTDSGYGTVASEKETLSKTHESREANAVLQDSPLCRESQACPPEPGREQERPRGRCFWSKLFSLRGGPVRDDSDHGAMKDESKEQFEARPVNSLYSTESEVCPDASASIASAPSEESPEEPDETSSLCSHSSRELKQHVTAEKVTADNPGAAETDTGASETACLSVAQSRRDALSTGNLPGNRLAEKRPRPNHPWVKTIPLQAAASTSIGATYPNTTMKGEYTSRPFPVDPPQKYIPKNVPGAEPVVAEQQHSDTVFSLMIPSQPDIDTMSLAKAKSPDRDISRPRSDPLPVRKTMANAIDDRRHSAPTGTITRLTLRVPLSPEGVHEDEDSDDDFDDDFDDDNDYDEVATSGDDEENTEVYNDAASSHANAVSQRDGATGAGEASTRTDHSSKPNNNNSLKTVRNTLHRPDPDQPPSPASSVPAGSDDAVEEYSADAAGGEHNSSLSDAKKPGQDSRSRNKTTNSRASGDNTSDELHPTGRVLSGAPRLAKVKNTNLASMDRQAASPDRLRGGSLGSRQSGDLSGPSGMPALLDLTKGANFASPNKNNLLSSYSAEMSTQTSDGSQHKHDLLGEKWQFSGVFSPAGGQLRKENSDVRLIIPKGCVPLATEICGSIHTKMLPLRRKLFRKHSDYALLSPVAEYTASVAAFGTRATIEIPYVEPAGFKKTCFKVMGFRCDNNGEITIFEVPCIGEDENGSDGTTQLPECYFTFSAPGQVTVHTLHFSGYYCVHCKRNISSILYAVAFGSHTLGSTQKVRVRLYVEDNKISLKDYLEEFKKKEKEAGRSYLDKKEIRLKENIHSRTFLIFELSPEGETAEQWSFSRRRGGQELRTPRRQRQRLEDVTQCCVEREASFVEWLLETGQAEGAGAGAVEFECSVDIWNHHVDANLLDSSPDSFQPDSKDISARSAHTVLNLTTTQPLQATPMAELFKNLELSGASREVMAQALLASKLSEFHLGQSILGSQQGFPETPQLAPRLCPPRRREEAQCTPPPEEVQQAMAELPRDQGLSPRTEEYPAMQVQRRGESPPPGGVDSSRHPVQEVGGRQEVGARQGEEEGGEEEEEEEEEEETTVLK